MKKPREWVMKYNLTWIGMVLGIVLFIIISIWLQEGI